MRAILTSVWFRLLVTAALLALVATRVDWSAFAEVVGNASASWLGAALAAGVAALVVGGVRWWWLLREAEVRLSGPEVGRVYAMSTFSSAFLLVGGDVARALLVTRERKLLLKVGLTVVADRAAAFVAMLLVAWVAIAAEETPLPEGSTIVLAALTAAALLGGAAILGYAARGRFPGGRLGRGLRAAASAVRELAGVYRRRPATTAIVAVTSVVFQVLAAAQLCLMAKAYGLDLSLAAAAVTLTLVTVATLLPVSIAGFGVREGSYVVLLAPFGIEATDAVAISLTATVMLLLASLPGALLLVRHGTKPVMG
jgi:glycosyltransferase 2 family protein